jgi:hypothetical protein
MNTCTNGLSESTKRVHSSQIFQIGTVMLANYLFYPALDALHTFFYFVGNVFSFQQFPSTIVCLGARG